MTIHTDQPLSPAFYALMAQARRADRVVLACLALFALIAMVDLPQAPESFFFVLDSLLWIAPFLLLSVAAAAAAKATGADAVIAQVFTGKPYRMIVVAALFGSLSPFCSCGVIPVIAGLLAAGVPLAPVMAFWISSPLMDPEMFILSSASLGIPFATAKMIATIGIGLMAGFATHAAIAGGLFDAPLRGAALEACCDTACGPSTQKTQWRFWTDAPRRKMFADASIETGWFLTKWLVLAFIIESLMTAYVPTDLIVSWLGSGHWWTIPAAVFASVPAYLNGYAAIPLMARLMDMGMMPGAAMGFLLGGGITSIPAAIAVFVLVRRAVFMWYLALAVTGSMLAALIFQATL